MLMLKAKLGDKITITDDRTGEVTSIEIDSTQKKSVRLAFTAPQHIKIDRIKLKDRDDAGSFAAPSQADEQALCTWPNGQTETVTILARRVDGRVDIRQADQRKTQRMTVPASYITALTH